MFFCFGFDFDFDSFFFFFFFFFFLEASHCFLTSRFTGFMKRPMSKSLEGATDLLLNDDHAGAPLLAPAPIEPKRTSAVSTFFIFLKSYLGSGIMV
jgi:hypothetical protein